MATMWGTRGVLWIKLLFGVKITQRISRPLATVRRCLILFHDAGCPQVPDMKITVKETYLQTSVNLTAKGHLRGSLRG